MTSMLKPSATTTARDSLATKVFVQDKVQESPADARVTGDSAVIPRWPSAAILDIMEPEIPPFDPPTPKTLA